MATTVTGPQLKAARSLLGFSQQQVAKAIGISVDTIWRAERDHPGAQRTKLQLVGLLRRNGIVFATDGSIRRSDDASTEYRAWRARWG
jgi:transcriptional regulator with XRE-family HTH domain